MPKYTKRCAFCKSPKFNKDANKLFKKFKKCYSPTPKDLSKQLNYKELIELCLNVPCRVQMNRWNAVHDYAQYFEEQGRLQTKSKYSADRLLAKAVNRHKSIMVYKDTDIWVARRREWCQRKKDNLMRLELWRHDKENGLNSRGLPLGEEL